MRRGGGDRGLHRVSAAEPLGVLSATAEALVERLHRRREDAQLVVSGVSHVYVQLLQRGW